MIRVLVLFAFIICGCQSSENSETNDSKAQNRFEKISYYKLPPSNMSQKAFKYRLSYYYDNGVPYRWTELDSAAAITTDYIYQYDANWLQKGAIYREDRVKEYSQELVRFDNDSTQITEWVDSTNVVYYTMIDNLNKSGKTYRAAFIGDTIHGYDSTFYTKEGFVKRIFFTNNKGKIFNDRSFIYDSINENGDWTFRKKIMNDTVVEYQEREVYYDSNFTSENGQYYESLISTAAWDENVISFSSDEDYVFLTRTNDWSNQFGFIAEKSNGVYNLPERIPQLDSIYNAAISPDGNRIIYTRRNKENEDIWLLEKSNGQWTKETNLSETSGIHGGYFNWLNKEELYFYIGDNNGDIVKGQLSDTVLTITDSLNTLNTKNATEFSPFIDKQKRFIIFTRYLEGNEAQQGFFISYNEADSMRPQWSEPRKISTLPYGWSPYVNKDYTRFIYSDGKNIKSVSLEVLELKLSDN